MLYCRSKIVVTLCAVNNKVYLVFFWFYIEADLLDCIYISAHIILKLVLCILNQLIICNVFSGILKNNTHLI